MKFKYRNEQKSIAACGNYADEYREFPVADLVAGQWRLRKIHPKSGMAGLMERLQTKLLTAKRFQAIRFVEAA